MALTEFLAGRAPTYDHDKDPLASPLPQEADDLRIHVEMCAKRYGSIMEGLALANRNTYDIKALIVSTMLILRVTVLVAVAVAGALLGPDLLVQLLKVM